MVFSSLKAYRSPSTVVAQWWLSFAARRPRAALAVKIMVIYFILAAVTDPVVHADDGKKSSGDAFTLFLDTSNLKDKDGIELSRYSTLPLDRGDAMTFSKTVVAFFIDFQWGAHFGMIALALSLLHYVLSFQWLDWILSPFMFIGAQVSPLMERMHIQPMILTIVAAFFSLFFFVLHMRGAATAELAIILTITTLISGSALANPTAKLRDHQGDDGTKQTGWLLNATTWGSDVATDIYFHDKKRAQIEASGMGTGLTNQKPEDIITRSLASVLIREPFQVVSFGQNLDGKCKKEFDSMLRDKDYQDVASNDRRDAITGSSGCSDTKKWVDNPNFYRAVLLATYTLGALSPLFLVAVFIGLIFKAVFDACVNGVLATVFAWYAMLPMVDRYKFFVRVVGTFYASMQCGALIGILILYLYVLEQYYEATRDWAPILRSIIMAVLVFILAKKTWAYFRDHGLDGSALAERLSRLGLKGATAAAPVKFAGAAPAFSAKAIQATGMGAGASASHSGAVEKASSGSQKRGLLGLGAARFKKGAEQPAYSQGGVPQNHAAMRRYMGPAHSQYYKDGKRMARRGKMLKRAGTFAAFVPGSFVPGMGMRVAGTVMARRGQRRMMTVERRYAYPSFSINDQLRHAEERSEKGEKKKKERD